MSAVEELERASNLCERVGFGAREDLQATLLEPIACFLGAETASFRSFSVAQCRPSLDALVVVGIPDSVNDAYKARYIHLDPVRRLLQQQLTKPLFAHRTRYGEWSNESTKRALREQYRLDFLQYRREFLLPNGFCHHLGFCFQAPGARTLLFDFHRIARSPEFSRLERARAQIVGVVLHAKAAQCRHEEPPHIVEFDDQLSLREVEVAKAVAAGLSNKEVGAALGISVRTVENHMRSIFTKLDVTTRARLAAKLRALVARPLSTGPTIEWGDLS